MLHDKYRPTEHIFSDERLTLAGRFLMLLGQAPPCICGADCRTPQYLSGELKRMQSKDTVRQ
ncbi:MAG: hypothetical protein ACLP5V_01465 [Candidatus Bathyarchaeia archaeon]